MQISLACSEHATDLLDDVWIGVARAALEAQEPARAESYLLRANRADIILAYYKETAAWPDALRIARDYSPESLAALQADYERAQRLAGVGVDGAEALLAAARDWELQEDYRNAIDCYLKVEAATKDAKLVAQAYAQAGELAIKFETDSARLDELVTRIGARLQALSRHLEASELYLAGGRPEEAVRALIAANEWAKAKKVGSISICKNKRV